MKDESLYIDQFDAFLQGDMSAEDIVTFEKRLAEDKEFAEAFKVHQIVIEGIKESGKAELKAYLKENGKILYWGSNEWPKSMRFAAAAVFIISLGVYLLVKSNLEPESKQNIAVVNNETSQPERGAVDSVYPLERSKTVLELDEKQTEDIENMSPPVLVIQDEVVNDANEILTDKMYTQGESDDKITTQRYEYEIHSEKKLKDTIVTIPILAMIDANKKNIDIKPGYTSQNATKSMSGGRSKQLPKNASNNVQAETLNKIAAETDSIEVKEVETGGKKLKDEKALEQTYFLEFWSSPINFKGYRYINNIIQLYSVDASHAKLFSYNNHIYLRVSEKVYLLAPCSSACAFKPEVDKDIIELIRAQ